MKNIFFLLAAITALVSCSDADNKFSYLLPVTNPVEVGIDTTKRLPMGKEVGSKAPGFAARDHLGKSFDLYSELQEAPVMVIFYRGKWCPECNKYMSNLNDSIGYILQHGVRIVAITPELKNNAVEFAQNTETTFPILSDSGDNIMKAFKVSFDVTGEYQTKINNSLGVDIATNNGQKSPVLPVPAVYLIDTNGTIRYRYFNHDYHFRPNISELAEAAKIITGNS